MSGTSTKMLQAAAGVPKGETATVAYVASSSAFSITSIDISNPNSLTELDSLTNANLNGAYNVALNIPGPASTNAYPAPEE